MIRRAILSLALLALPLAIGACAAGGAGSGGSGNPDLLTIEDFQQYEAMDAYAVIRRLRGNWLNTRATGTMIDPDVGANNPAQIKVYVDGALQPQGVEALKDLPITQVREMRHMNARDATMQYGTDHGAGAILVTTGR